MIFAKKERTELQKGGLGLVRAGHAGPMPIASVIVKNNIKVSRFNVSNEKQRVRNRL